MTTPLLSGPPERSRLLTVGALVSRLFRIIVGVFAIGFMALALFGFDLWKHALVGPHFQGAIIVSEPEVYTRERLVNDRFRQQRWLEGQLAAMDSEEMRKQFAMPQAAVQQRSERGGSLRVASPAKDAVAPYGTSPAAEDRTETETALPLVALSAADQFRDRLAYRNEVNQELMLTQLDDRHDIAGNTLIRLDFDAAILPMEGATDTAMIFVTAQGRPIHRTQRGLQSVEIGQLYEDWRVFLQEQYDEAVINLATGIKLPTAAAGRGLLRQINQFSGFLDDINVQRLSSLSNDDNLNYLLEVISDKLKDDDRCISDEYRIKDKCDINDIYNVLFNFGKEIYENNVLLEYFEALKFPNSQLIGDSAKITAARIIFNASETACQIGAGSSLGAGDKASSTGSEQDAGRYFGVKATPEAREKIARDIMKILQRRTTSPPASSAEQLPMLLAEYALIDKIPCPQPLYSQPISELDVKIAILVALERAYKNSPESLLCTFAHGLNADPEKLGKSCGGQTRGLNPSDGLQLASARGSGDSVQWSCNKCTAQFRASDVYRRYASAIYHLWRADQAGEGYGVRLSRFYSTALDGCALARCRVILGRKQAMGPSQMSIPAQLASALERHARLFTYSVTPEQTFEKIDTEGVRKTIWGVDADSSLPQMQGANVYLAFREAVGNRLRAFESNPIVVGFAEHNEPAAPTEAPCVGTDLRSTENPPGEYACRRRTSFGWIVRPPTSTGTGGRSQRPVHHTLSATLSVPSWWRSLFVTIRRCWVSELDLANRPPSEFPDARAGEVCPAVDGENTETFEVRLPGSISEVARKLGIEVLSEPYVKQSSQLQQQYLEIGRPGQIVLEGVRLWRSTVVTLGGYQRADAIEVMPNMMGIVATFDCVQPPASWPRGVPQIVTEGAHAVGSAQSAIVWTSEGRTEPAPVALVPFRTSLASGSALTKSPLAETPCWMRRAGTSNDERPVVVSSPSSSTSP